MSITKIIDSGDPTARLNVIVLGHMLTDFEVTSRAADMLSLLTRTAWWVNDTINVWALPGLFDFKVGITKDPGALSSGYLPGDHKAVSAMLAETVPWYRRDRDVAIVLASPTVGPRGSADYSCRVVLTATDYDYSHRLEHELGHALGGCADEYYGGGGRWVGAEPAAPNVSRDGAKWRDLATPHVPWPARLNNFQAQERIDHIESVVSFFEGAYNCMWGIGRAQLNCKMREHAQPFCAVCLRAMKSAVAVWKPGAPPPPPLPTTFQARLYDGLSQAYTREVALTLRGRRLLHYAGKDWLLDPADDTRYMREEPLVLS